MEERSAAELLLQRMKRAALNEIAEKSGLPNPPKKNAASGVIAKWILKNVQNLDEYLPECAAFAYIPEFDRAQERAIRFFRGKSVAGCFLDGNTEWKNE